MSALIKQHHQLRNFMRLPVGHWPGLNLSKPLLQQHLTVVRVLWIAVVLAFLLPMALGQEKIACRDCANGADPQGPWPANPDALHLTVFGIGQI